MYIPCLIVVVLVMLDTLFYLSNDCRTAAALFTFTAFGLLPGHLGLINYSLGSDA